MNKMNVAERVFLCMGTVSFAVLLVALLALTISEEQVAQKQRQKQEPSLGVISKTTSVR
jgi:hypothetical protein